MNIFILSLCVIECAMYHCDSHCVKMPTEIAQLLCSAHRILDPILDIDFDKICYKIFGKNHPCAIWVRTSSENYLWLYSLFIELCKEYTRRYSKIHECEKKFKGVLNKLPKNIPIGPITPFVQAISNKNINETDTVLAYRMYYLIDKKQKDLLTWKTREPPPWIPEVEEYIRLNYKPSIPETIKTSSKRVTYKVIIDFLKKEIKNNPELKEKLKGILD